MRKDKSHKQGSAVVEFALVLAILMVPLMAGVWDVSKFIDINQILTRAAREGVVSASRGQDPTDMIRQYAETSGLMSENLTVSIEYGADEDILGQEVRVVLAYDFRGYTIFPWEDIIPSGLTTAASAKME